MTFAAYQTTRIALLALASFGAVAGGRLSLDHLQHGEICPTVGSFPACIIVFLGYFLIVLSALFIRNKAVTKLFYVGWAPVFLLAATGVILELTKGRVCPPGAFGIPQCFFSLTMILLCLGLFRYSRNSGSSA